MSLREHRRTDLAADELGEPTFSSRLKPDGWPPFSPTQLESSCSWWCGEGARQDRFQGGEGSPTLGLSNEDLAMTEQEAKAVWCRACSD